MTKMKRGKATIRRGWGLRRSSRGCWVLLWRWDAIDGWEHFLSERRAPFVKYVLDGMPRLYIYHL